MLSDRLLSIIELQAQLTAKLTAQTIQMLFQAWRDYRWWTDYDRGISQAARTATIVESGFRSIQKLENTYFDQVYRDLGVDRPQRDAVTVTQGMPKYPRIGVTPLEVYQRPLETYRYTQSKGESVDISFGYAMDRLETMVTTDLSLAKREQIQRIFRETNDPKVIGYRRIIHPELSRTGSCGLCVVAATRIYHTSELLPIHDDCNCDVLPITKGNDPGLDLNDRDLQRIYDAAGSTGAGDLLKTKIHFTDHGELGPIITGGNRKGSKQRKHAADRKPLTEVESARHQLHTLMKSSESLQRRLDAGEDVAQPLQWQRDRILNLQAKLRSLGVDS